MRIIFKKTRILHQDFNPICAGEPFKSLVELLTGLEKGRAGTTWPTDLWHWPGTGGGIHTQNFQ
eukprot:413142-Hanusia_phi.AAC.1